MHCFNSNFIGYNANTLTMFSGSDHKERFEQNLKTQPEDWYYRNVSIQYDYNEYGHRCKNISEIDLDNYILFSGCSYTEGIGLELEKTFPYLAANELGVDYYNLALGGSGIDAMTYNLIAWINTVKKPPKAVVIVWTYEPRFLLIENDKVMFNLASSPNDSITRFMALGGKIGYFSSKKELSRKMIELCYSDSTIVQMNADDIQEFDLARDLGHVGNMSHAIMAKKILNYLK